jgi:hypothetical protein
VGVAVLAHPWVVALRRRFAPQLVFLQARLSPEGYLGLHLTVGLVVIVLSGWLFSGIGSVEVSSQLGVGSRFTLMLPMTASPAR